MLTQSQASPLRFLLLVILLMATITGVTAAESDTARLIPGPLDPNDPAWTQVDDRDGVQVLLRDIEGSGIEAFQGRTTIKIGLAPLLAVMEDPEACPKWVHQCVEARTLEGDFSHAYEYGVNDLPWPANDRDYVIEIRNTHDKTTGMVHRMMRADPDRVALTDHTRVTTLTSHFWFRPLTTDETEIIWTTHAEPGGMIPEWMVNMLLVDIPHESLEKLAAAARADHYQKARLLKGADGAITGVEH